MLLKIFKTFLFVSTLFCINSCYALENSQSPQHFSVIAVPPEIEEETSTTTPTTTTQPSLIQLKPKVSYRGKPEIRENYNDGSTQLRPFSGITEKLRNNQPVTGGIRINSRGRSGVMQTNENQESILDFPITWSEAHSQSVKRVYVRQKVVGVGNERSSFVKLQPIVPFNSNGEDVPPTPPPHDQIAKMARFVVHSSNWTSIATISSRSPTIGFPFANVFSVSDGSFNGNSSGSGIPYLYLTPLEISVIDLKKNSKCSLTMSLAQSDYCRSQGFDPEDPRCAHVILTGNVVPIKNGTTEANFARQALFSRHPDMPSWPQDHGWFFAKLEILHILVLDYFGGAKSVTPKEYFAAN